jgi:RNA polymerase sigma-70 factor, ECF subfamily
LALCVTHFMQGQPLESLEPATVAAARRGDRVAQAALLRAFQDQWYRMVLRLLGDVEAAREATQETALRFLTELPGFEGRSEIRTWSLGSAINVAREMRRGRRLDEFTLEMAPAVDGPDQELEQRELAQILNQRIDALPLRQREAVVLRFFEELNVEQTAAAMGCAAGTVKALVFQAMRNLRQSFRPQKELSDEPVKKSI